MELKNSYAVVLVTVIGVFLAVVKFLAFNGFRNRAEFPGDAPLTVEFLLSFLAQLPLGNKPGHDDHSLRMAMENHIIFPDGWQSSAAGLFRKADDFQRNKAALLSSPRQAAVSSLFRIFWELITAFPGRFGSCA